ncbi:MAG: metallophosphatase family protein [Bacteroidales bacterium]|nr:metallophosphatase family protein [Bacteroidales bacterium]MCL2133723.1 metallophosphatase family protein [Bacteroidales bacterium]
MKRIGLLSDTHGYFDEKLYRFFDSVDELWHVGDIGNIDLVDEIAAFKPLKAVFGNCDDWHIRRIYPEIQRFTEEGVDVLMMHIGGYPGNYSYPARQMIEAAPPKLFISGHSHILKVMNDKHFHLLHINPGAAGIQGFHNVRTAVRFIIDAGTIRDLEVGEWLRSNL